MGKSAAGKGAGRGIALGEDDARNLLLIRALEMRDTDEQLLTREDRAQADAFARGVAADKGRRAPQAYLAARSLFAVERLEARHPAIARALKLSRYPRWLLSIPGVAFIFGIVSNELDGGSRLELLAFPLLGVIAWNIAVFIGMLFAPLARLGRARDIADDLPRRRWWQLVGNPIAAIGGGGASGLTRDVLGDFAKDWARASGSLYASRTSAMLHLSAALFAIGLVAGIFLRALTVEYRAGWESTFLGPGQVEALLSFLLGPAAALTGIAIPGESGIAALRWTGAGGELGGGANSGGANAGRWIILWTATVIGIVAIPRLVLAGWQAVGANVAARRVKVPGRDDFYVRRLLRAVGKGGSSEGGIRVTPYAYTPDETSRTSLQTVLRDVIGEGANVTIDPPCPYGAEEDWLAHIPPDEDADLHVVLFSLSATPEAENHATFVRLLREFYDHAGQGVRVAALVDEQPFRAHFAGQAGLDRRIEERLESWRTMMAKVNTAMVPLALDGHASREVAEMLEPALLGQEKR